MLVLIFVLNIHVYMPAMYEIYFGVSPTADDAFIISKLMAFELLGLLIRFLYVIISSSWPYSAETPDWERNKL